MKPLLLFLTLFLSSLLAADEVLYCIPKLSTGFDDSDNFSKSINFSQPRFSVKVHGDFEKIDIGNNPLVCETRDESIYTCTHAYDYGTFFKYNKNTKRFLSVVIGDFGYLSYPSKTGQHDSDVLRAGECEKF
jgi:hypothetical protein